MSRIAILCNIIEPGGMGNDVFGMYEHLSAQGHEVALFGEVWRNNPYPVRHFDEAAKFVKDRSACLIYHFAIGWDPGLQILKSVRCKKVVRYHNVTPPEFYEPYSTEHANVCRRGRDQIPLIAHAGADLYLSDSEYNASELVRAGLNGSPSLVIPPFHKIDRLEAIEADPEVLQRFGQPAVTNVLTVGRVVPNKRHDLLIEAFAEYHRDYNPASQLVIVGAIENGLKSYNQRLEELIDRRGLRNAVHFPGAVSDASLKAFYQAATVFMTTSEHEGFCVPLVEAMALKVPIVAVASSAVLETVGKAGLVWEKPDPSLLAASIHAVAADDGIRSGLAAMGLQRYRDMFSNRRTRDQLVSALNRVLS
jgi:glycosyltransferase involved in cell wall biosynthesis